MNVKLRNENKYLETSRMIKSTITGLHEGLHFVKKNQINFLLTIVGLAHNEKLLLAKDKIKKPQFLVCGF